MLGTQGRCHKFRKIFFRSGFKNMAFIKRRGVLMNYKNVAKILAVFSFSFFQCLFSMNAQGALIGVIDSGTDVRHVDLANSIWRNPNETRANGYDDDGNDFIDDIYGWNFAENNADVIDYKYLGSFSPDVYRFFN